MMILVAKENVEKYLMSSKESFFYAMQGEAIIILILLINSIKHNDMYSYYEGRSSLWSARPKIFIFNIYIYIYIIVAIMYNNNVVMVQ
jgi:hypothetical protein